MKRKRYDGKEYFTYYIKIPIETWPHLERAWRVRLLVAPADFSTPPVEVIARLHRRTRTTVDLEVAARYKPTIEAITARAKTVAVLGVEVLQTVEEAELARRQRWLQFREK